MRILIAGFQHETNTFAPSKADWAAFESGSAFPAFSRGAAMLERLAARGKLRRFGTAARAYTYRVPR